MDFFKEFPTERYDFEGKGFHRDIRNIFRYVVPDFSYLDDSIYFIDYVIDNGERPDILSHKLYGNSGFWWTFFLINEHLIQDVSNYPLSQEGKKLYYDKYFNQYKIFQFDPKLDLDDNLQVKRFVSNINGLYEEGEIITGKTSGATAKIMRRNSKRQQLTVKILSGQFLDNEFITNELGEETDVRFILDHLRAIHHYEIDGIWVEPIEIGFPFTFPYLLSDYSIYIDTAEIKSVTYYDWEESLNDEHSKIKIISPEHIRNFANKYFELLK